MTLSFVLALASLATRPCVEIPFRWTPGQIEIQVSLNRRPPLWFILDSGAEYSVIGSDVAQAAGLQTSKRLSRDFATGVILDIGGVTLRDQDVMVLPLNNFKAQHRDIHGLVGYDFFARAAVTIDYEKKVISACDAQAFRADPHAAILPLTFAGRLPVVEVVLTLDDGTRLPLRAMVDLGAQIPMMVRYPFASAHDLLRSGSDPSTAPSVLGPRPIVRLPAQRITIGPWTIDSLAVEADSRPAGAAGSTDTDALIGNDLLRHFRVTFDYSRRRLILEKR